MKVLGVIPARGGSKGVPKKNVKLLGGKPLIAYSIEAARAAKRLTRVIVSTDDEEIAEVSRRWGADAPFLRPAELATDAAKAVPVIQHALEEMEGRDDQVYDAVMMLQPTTPFRTGADIDRAIEILEKTGADSVISVVDVEGHHPARMKYLEDGRLIDPDFCEAYENQPRQELRPMYLRNGMIYLTRREVMRSGSFKGSDCRALIVETHRSVNIDTPLDFELAEFLYKRILTD
ncbi:MAG: acylneuraminate cytidylyltransferase family protein [Saprospiraceae bacterium]|nr:acylneuraminate cytidylyltransferase family protein [Saprospiraceae bacterium]